MALIHGGDVESFRMKYGYTPLDFSANCNPLGMPAGVKEAIRSATDHADGYPDPLCRKLRAGIAEERNLLPEQVLCGNGAADIIYRLVLTKRPKFAIVLSPTFSEYESALQLVSCHVMHHSMNADEDFRLTGGILDKLKPNVDMLFLCNPNNPTGMTIQNELMQSIINACLENDILLVVDECFNCFLDQPETHTLMGKLLDYKDNLVVLDAFTKRYSMAGVRLGFCLSANTKLLRDMEHSGQPWSVSTLAQAGGIAALKEKEYLEKSRAVIQRERQFMTEILEKMGIPVIGSEANYIFFYTNIPHIASLLQDQGILIRDCSNFAGLTQGYYRIAIREHHDNMKFIEALTGIE